MWAPAVCLSQCKYDGCCSSADLTDKKYIFSFAIHRRDAAFTRVLYISFADCHKVVVLISVTVSSLQFAFRLQHTFQSGETSQWNKDNCLLQQMICDDSVGKSSALRQGDFFFVIERCQPWAAARWIPPRSPYTSGGWWLCWDWWWWLGWWNDEDGGSAQTGQRWRGTNTLKDERKSHHLKRTAVRR